MCEETMIFCVACVNSTKCTDCVNPYFLKQDNSACVENCTLNDTGSCSDATTNVNSYKCLTATI